MDTQVIVVGGGPVGLLLAGLLRLHGASVVVVERLERATTESRASTLHARTMEIFDQCGLLEALGTPPNDAISHFGGIPLDLGGLPSPYPGQWKVPQTRVEELLGEWATGLGAQLRRGWELTGLAEVDDHVQARLATPAGSVLLRARYLVGCDGESSTVRELARFAFPGDDADKEMLRADVAGIEIPARRFERFPNGLAVAGRRPDGVTRVMVHEFGARAGNRSGDPEFAEIAKVWARVTGEDIAGATPLWLNAFDNRRRQVAHYRKGRVLLAGDAAHVQMPVGGQALNLGLQDAANLGWKLAAVVAGRTPDELLDTYHTERHAVGEAVLANIQAQALVLLGGREVEPLRRILADLMGADVVRSRLAEMVSGLDIRYGTGPDGHPLLGRRLPPVELRTPAGTIGSLRLLRSGRGQLIDLSGAAAPTRSAAPWADRVDTVAAEPMVQGPLAGVGAVLLRPDGHVAWVGAAGAGTEPGVDTELRRWFGVPVAN